MIKPKENIVLMAAKGSRTDSTDLLQYNLLLFLEFYLHIKFDVEQETVVHIHLDGSLDKSLTKGSKAVGSRRISLGAFTLDRSRTTPLRSVMT